MLPMSQTDQRERRAVQKRLSMFAGIVAILMLVAAACTPPPPDNEGPFATFVPSVSNGPAPLAVNFDASSSGDPDGTIVQYSWDFGDFNTGAGETIDHTFARRPVHRQADRDRRRRRHRLVHHRHLGGRWADGRSDEPSAVGAGCLRHLRRLLLEPGAGCHPLRDQVERVLRRAAVSPPLRHHRRSGELRPVSGLRPVSRVATTTSSIRARPTVSGVHGPTINASRSDELNSHYDLRGRIATSECG